MKKIMKILGCMLLALSLVACKEGEKEMTDNNIIVSTMDETINENALWCGSFQLAWNELKEKYGNNQNIEFKDGNNSEADHLNNSSFNKDDINEDSYYVNSGYLVPALKEEIEKAIKDKFNQTSDILGDFNFEENSKDLFIYAMLYKEFQFETKFIDLDEDAFNDDQEAKYFGVDNDSDDYDEMIQQIHVLYYEDYEHFALCIDTKQEDQIIVSCGVDKDTFNEIYETIQKNAAAYNGDKSFTLHDTFKMPYIDINEKISFNNLTNHPFDITVDGNQQEYAIDKAIQTIKFSLNEEGGKVKSEAGMSMKLTALPPEDERYFDVNSTFTLFLVEKNADTPYLALKVSDINLIQ